MLTINNNINNMSSASEISLAGSIMQQLTSSSQSSQSSSSLSLTLSLASNQKSMQSKSFRMSTTSKLESDQILSSSSNYIIQAGSAALAEAELDEIDDMIEEGSMALVCDEVEFMDNEASLHSTDSSPIQVSKTHQQNENSKQIANSTKTLTGSAGDKCNDLMSIRINNIKTNFLNSVQSTTSSTTATLSTNNMTANSVVLAPEEKVSNEAKEYWATIDLYNNSKMAFNKRVKSVKLKREKLNAELIHRNQCKQEKQTQSSTNNLKSKDIDHHVHQTNPNEPCMCVKCSIEYHESVIKSKVSANEAKLAVCNKCNKNSCKCCQLSSTSINDSTHDLVTNTAKTSSSSISSNTTISNRSASSLSNNSECNETKKSPQIKEELNQLEEKLFNIKNELVNLSETSLDVFQLLLQLSDTMLDINTQINSNNSSNYSHTTNSNQLFSLNTFLGSDANNFLYEEEGEDQLIEEHMEQIIEENESNKKILDKDSANTHKSNVIEEFLHKTLHTSHSSSNSLRVNPSNSGSSISNIINTLNNRNSTRNGSFLSTPSQSFRSTLIKNNKQTFNKPLHLKQLQNLSDSSSSSSPSSVANLIENIYDKTSVTQFVDSLLNHNSSKKTQSINSIDETSNISDCCFSTLSSTNNEPVYQSIDPDFLNRTKKLSAATTLTTSQILARQPLSYLVSNKHQSFNLKKASSSRETFTPMKSSKSNCSSTSSSSSGCGGSSSICSSSNNDLTSYLTHDNSNNNRNSTSSTTSSVLASPMSCLSASSSNNEILHHITNKKTVPEHKQYESVSSSSSSASSPQNSLVSGHLVASSSFYSNSPTLSSNQYKRSNSVNYKSITNAATSSSSSITNRKPSFKFESNILNKVQFMNMNKPEKQLKSLNESTVIPNHVQDNHNKRNSLGRDDFFEQTQKLIKRQQSINSNKSYNNQISGVSHLKTINHTINTTTMKTPTSPSIIINQIKMNQHQMSLDSGIFLPSETEEFNSFNLNLVR